MPRSHSISKVRFSSEVSRPHSADYWDPAEGDDDRKMMLSKPVLVIPASIYYNNNVRGRSERRRWEEDEREREKACIKLPMMFVFVVVLLVSAVGFAIIFWENGAEGTDNDILVNCLHGAVSSDVEICSHIGVNLLKKGGNAVDAIIGTGVCIGTVNSFASGIGGGGFMVVRTKYGDSKSFNFREMAPGASTRNMYQSDPMLAQVGGLAVAIPGEVHGYATAHAMFGKLPWRDIWQPSIDLSRSGFHVTPTLRKIIMKDATFFRENRKNWEFLFSKETGDLVQTGEIMKRPKFADTLEIIAGGKEGGEGGEDVYKGVEEFYNGTIAEKIATFVQNNGGILTKEDFGEFFTVVEDTAKTEIMDMEVITCQPPCRFNPLPRCYHSKSTNNRSGPVLIEGLNIAEGLDMRDSQNPLSYHLLIETMKWLSAGRTELGDPFDPIMASNIPRIHELTSKSWAATVRANISNDRTYSWEHYKPAYEATDPKGTSHLSVFDRNGGAAALTTTVNLYWGAKLHDPATGIIMNSEMDDFSIPGNRNAYELQPSIYNYILPFKRPLSSTAPTIIVESNGNPGLVIGGSGGSRIVTGVFEAIVKTYFWGYELLDTIKSPRLHHQLIPEIVSAEFGVEGWIIKGLEERGHNISQRGIGEAAGGSVLQAVKGIKGGRIEGVADWWRKGGKAAGY